MNSPLPEQPLIACYCRVSSDTQKHDSQRSEIKRWLTGHKINPDSVTWYEDVETGATLARQKAGKEKRDLLSLGRQHYSHQFTPLIPHLQARQILGF